MHDKRGRQIEVGDVVAGFNWNSQKVEALEVKKCIAGATSCNLMVNPFEIKQQHFTVNAHDTLLLVKASGEIVYSLPESEVTNA